MNEIPLQKHAHKKGQVQESKSDWQLKELITGAAKNECQYN